MGGEDVTTYSAAAGTTSQRPALLQLLAIESQGCGASPNRLTLRLRIEVTGVVSWAAAAAAATLLLLVPLLAADSLTGVGGLPQADDTSCVLNSVL